MGLLSSITGAFKGIAKVLDNPLSRAVASVTGNNAGAAILANIAGNQAGVAGLLGASRGATTDAQSNLPTFQPQVINPMNTGLLKSSLQLLKFDTGSMPGSGVYNSVDAAVGGYLPGGVNSNITFTNGLTPGSVCYKTLRNGKIRVGRVGTDKKPHFTRRMNPMNPRAARRAIKRITAVRHITRAIEATLPRARTRTR